LYQNKQSKTVFIFENRRELVGVSNPHPHCQIYGVPFVMDTIGRELAAVQRYRQQQNMNLFFLIIRAEQEDGRCIYSLMIIGWVLCPILPDYPTRCTSCLDLISQI
jgi:UDPglucose--hexose-1-phosphate uridylyltransferase